MARRHESLIPLSRQHQHALALALIIRRRDGIERGEAAWLEETSARIRNAYAAELAGHFEVEEAVLFPDMQRYLGRIKLIAELVEEHHTLRGFVQQIEAAPAVSLLDDFSARLDAHVCKEERQLFVEFEKRMPAEEALKLGREIDARLMKACPRL
jgi:iron-sulfur cluster repair protein YtfE (RIC family)